MFGYIILAILIIIATIGTVLGWRMHNSHFQCVSMLSIYAIIPTLFYWHLINLARESQDWVGGAITLGFFSCIIFITPLTLVAADFDEYNDQTKNASQISLHDFNSYVTLNPNAWEITRYTLYNSQVCTHFYVSYWELLILHLCRKLRIDAKTNAKNNVTCQRLCEYVQSDIQRKQRQNQEQMKKAFDAINGSRNAQKDMIASYSEQTQPIIEELLKTRGR